MQWPPVFYAKEYGVSFIFQLLHGLLPPVDILVQTLSIFSYIAHPTASS